MTNESKDIEDGGEEMQDITLVEVQPAAIDVNDVDASWDGKGSLDDHRQMAFAKVKQPGFGSDRKVKPDGE